MAVIHRINFRPLRQELKLMTTFPIGDTLLELNPKTIDEKNAKVDAIAKLPKELLPRLSAQDLRNLATGVLQDTRAKKADLVQKLLELTEARRVEIAARNAEFLTTMQFMNVDIDSLTNLINTTDPTEAADLAFNSFRSRMKDTTISKTLTAKLLKLVTDSPNISGERALEFKRRWSELVKPLTTAVNANYERKLSETQHNLRTVDYEAALRFAEVYLTDVSKYLANNSEELVKTEKKILWQGVLYALVIATGRRPCEVQSFDSQFKPLAKRKLLFSGQAKTKGRGDTGEFFIPTLVDADLCLNGLRYLELLGKRSDIKHGAVNAKYSKPLSSDMRKDVREHLLGIGILKPYDARHFYGSYFAEVYMQDTLRPNKSTRALLSRLLGHGEEDTNTGKTYEDMRVVLEATPEMLQEFNPLWSELFADDKVS